MYKKQMVFQKIVCFAVLFAAILNFIYALGILTDIYDAFYFTMQDPDDHTMTEVEGSIIYYDMQPFNKALLAFSLVMVLAAVTLFVMNTHIRRKYYKGNFITMGICAFINLGVSVYALVEVMKFRAQFINTVDFDSLKFFSDFFKTLYIGPEDTFWFDAAWVVYGIVLLTTAFLIGNMIWKVKLMKAEHELLQASEEA